VVQEDRVLAYWHAQTGEAEISPQLEQLKTERFVATNNPHLEAAASLARIVFERTDVLPKTLPSTRWRAIPMLGSTARKAQMRGYALRGGALSFLCSGASPGAGLSGVWTGVACLAGVDNVGLIQAFVLHWRAGSLNGEARKRVPRSKCMTR